MEELTRKRNGGWDEERTSEKRGPQGRARCQSQKVLEEALFAVREVMGGFAKGQGEANHGIINQEYECKTVQEWGREVAE